MSRQPQTPSAQITSELETAALTAIKRQLDAKEGGAVVRQSVKRHYEHLESLARSLRKLGMDERAVDESIMDVFREYERELTNYMGAV